MQRSYTNIEKAIAIALKAHAGQKDKGGTEYILHPLRLMMQMQENNEKIVAVLHDVIEDSNIKLMELSKAGFPKKIIKAIDLLTHKKGDSYFEFIEKIKFNPLARKIKIFDLEDNLNIKRIRKPTIKDIKRLKKYKEALRLLKSE